MGSDLSMNPPTPPSYAALMTLRIGAVAVYKFPGEMESGPRVWQRVFFLPVSESNQEAKEAVVMALQAMGQRVKQVESDALLAPNIDPAAMREILNPRPPVYAPKHAEA